METIKSVLGLGGSAPAKEESPPDQHPLSGEEPVSGQLGARAATEPYDPGNADGQSGSAAEKLPDSLPKVNAPPEPLEDDKTSPLNPKESTTTSSNLEPSSKPQEDLSSSPGLQGHPLPISSFRPTPTAEEAVSPYSFAPGKDTVPAQDTTLAQETTPAQSSAPAHDTASALPSAPAHDTAPAQDTVPARGTPAQDIVSAPDTSAQLGEQTQTKDSQPRSLVPEGSPESNTKGDVPQEKSSQSYGEPKTFVEREAARIAEETAPRDSTEDTGPSTSGAVADNTDHDLAETTKKMHLKDKIKEKLHFRKKSEAN